MIPSRRSRRPWRSATSDSPGGLIAENTARARKLVLEHGWNSTSYQILNPGIEHWFTDSAPAVVGYVRRHRYLLAAGAPVCPPDALPWVLREFEEFARSQSCKVCYVCAGDRLRALLADSPRHATITVGAQPVWNAPDWPQILTRRASLRAQLHRAANKNVRIVELPAGEAARDPRIQQVLHQWIEHRGLPPLHFLTEPEVLRGVVDDRLVLAAQRGGNTVAYLVASPVTARNGYLIEELARSPEAPNGTIELLIDAAMRHFIQRGNEYVTMGLVALTHNVFRSNPVWIRTLMYVARAHANRFYNFRGLEQFRAKMHPAYWEKIFCITNEPRFSVPALYAMGAAFSGISPLRAVSLGVVKGVSEEVRSLARRFRAGV
jgi:phosphatidylglycerol lysyltransferase